MKPLSKKEIDVLIENQKSRLGAVTMHWSLLKIYKNNPKHFYMLFSTDILRSLEYNDLTIFLNEFTDRVFNLYGNNMNFKLVSTGVYQYIDYSKKRNKNFISQFYAYYEPFTYGPWGL